MSDSQTLLIMASTDGNAELCDRVELLPGRLAFAVLASTSRASSSARGSPVLQDQDEQEEFASIDGELFYARFFADFGPLHLARTVQFCRDLEARVGLFTGQDASPTGTRRRRVVLYCSDHPHKRSNAMTLLAIFLVVARGFTPEQAVTRLLDNGKLQPPFGFRDAACGVCTFFITLLDCARAVHKAIATALWSYKDFSIDEYDHLDRLENGDINWMVPGKLIAFSGPQCERIVLDAESGATTLLARDYAAVFRSMGVTCVIRFNEASAYDRKAFIHAGLRHIDMPFPDGSNPSDEVLYKFIRVCERETGAVAVHCKAGLGRTGTAIAAFLMKNYRFSATEAIAWCRICRPGSIVGPQQHFLAVKQPELHALPSIVEVQPIVKTAQRALKHTKLERLPSRHQESRRAKPETLG